jgi:hypothetical protein
MFRRNFLKLTRQRRKTSNIFLADKYKMGGNRKVPPVLLLLES